MANGIKTAKHTNIQKGHASYRIVYNYSYIYTDGHPHKLALTELIFTVLISTGQNLNCTYPLAKYKEGNPLLTQLTDSLIYAFIVI